MNSTLMAVLKAVTVVSSIGLLLSLIPTYRRIHKDRTTGDFSIMPALTVCFSCSLWVVYGCMARNYVPVVLVDTFGTALAIGFNALFYKYAPERSYIRKIWLGVGLVEVVIMTYVILGVTGVTNQSRDQVRVVLGFITAGTDILLYSSPLATLRHVIKVKDATSIPLAMSIVALFNTALWVIISTDDLFLAIPNGLGCAFSVVGIVVFFIYRPDKFSSQLEQHRPESEANLREIHVEPSVKPIFNELRSPVVPMSTSRVASSCSRNASLDTQYHCDSDRRCIGCNTIH